MIELQDSIKKYGVLNPLIVRPRQEGYYEIISGHRRKYAAECPGYKKIPVIIRTMKDDEAVVKAGDKIGQLVIMPVLIPDFTFEEWKERGKNSRSYILCYVCDSVLDYCYLQ